MPRNNNYASAWVLVLLLIIGGLTGSVLGNALGHLIPWVSTFGNIGLKPATLDLQFISVTFGMTVELNPLTVLGLIVGYIVYRRV